MKKVIFALALLAAFSFSAKAQEFTPYPYVQLQGGVSYDFGNASFPKLLSKTNTLYGYKFVQPNVDLVLDWGAGLFGWRDDRPATVYTFFGVGTAIGLENGKAQDLAAAGESFPLLWQPVKAFWNTRSGIGTDIRLTDRMALNFEFDAQFYPESFNSRYNPKVAAGPDFHFALLGGLKFNLGWRPKKAKPAVAPASYQPRNEPKKQEPKKEYREEPAKQQPAEQPIYQGADVDIFFDLNKSVIRDDQVNTLNRLVSYMRNTPDAKVKLDGYADKQTGNAEINQELSEQRVIAVRQYLVSRGIDQSRISTAAHGDKVQPFSGAQNRAVTCRIR